MQTELARRKAALTGDVLREGKFAFEKETGADRVSRAAARAAEKGG